MIHRLSLFQSPTLAHPKPTHKIGFKGGGAKPDWQRKLDPRLAFEVARQDANAPDREVSLFIQLKTAPDNALLQRLAELGVRHGTPIAGSIMTGRIMLSRLESLARQDEVVYLEGSRRLRPAGG